MLDCSRVPIAKRQLDLGQIVLFSVICASWYILANREERTSMFPSYCSNDIHNPKGKLSIKLVEIMVVCVWCLKGSLAGI